MKTKSLIADFKSGKYNQKLLEIYTDEQVIPQEVSRYIDLLNEHLDLFGEQDVSIISVPGRSEITGNHTDHQNGRVLACSINLDIVAVVSKSDSFNCYSTGRLIRDVDINDLSFNQKQTGTSTALIKGVLTKLVENDYNIGNVNVVMRSNVPVGSGLSSSAAFEVMIGNIMNYMFNDGKIPQVEIAKYSQFAENVYFGKPSGLMDQCACAYGGLVYIDFESLQQPKIKNINLNLKEHGYSLCIIKTGGSHSDLTTDYAAIPNEMKKVANYFHKQVLRQVSVDDVLKHLDQIREQCGDRAVLRALHMLQEDERVEQQLLNITNNDFEKFLKTIKESGDSSYKYLQNIYSNKDITTQPIALALLLSEMYLKDTGVARVHGGGFAGTIQAFVKNECVYGYKGYMEQFFGKDSCLILQINNKGAHKVM